MNIFQVTKGSYELTQDQLALLFQHMDKYMKTTDGSWLSEIDYRKSVFMWAPSLEGSYIMAAKPLLGNSILVCPNGGNPDYWVSLVTPAVVHELRHLWQRKHNIVRYTLWSLVSRLVLPFSEDLYMKVPTEKDAFNQQSIMEDFIGGV